MIPTLYPAVVDCRGRPKCGFARDFTRPDVQVCAELGEHFLDGLSGSKHQTDRQRDAQVLVVFQRASRGQGRIGFETSQLSSACSPSVVASVRALSAARQGFSPSTTRPFS